MCLALAHEQFERWAQALRTKDASVVAALYQPHCTLLPTMARQVIHSVEGCTQYFEFFCSLHPKAEMVEEYVEQITEQAFLHSGVYRFTLGPQEDRQQVDARFSMLWKCDANGTWLIAHHHSSRFPDVPAR